MNLKGVNCQLNQQNFGQNLLSVLVLKFLQTEENTHTKNQQATLAKHYCFQTSIRKLSVKSSETTCMHVQVCGCLCMHVCVCLVQFTSLLLLFSLMPSFTLQNFNEKEHCSLLYNYHSFPCIWRWLQNTSLLQTGCHIISTFIII